MDHCDAPAVQKHILCGRGTAEAHSWMQKRFASLDRDTQSAYVDCAIHAVRYNEVKESTRQQLRGWLLLPRQYELSTRQITDFHAMLEGSRVNAWSVWLTLTCFDSD